MRKKERGKKKKKKKRLLNLNEGIHRKFHAQPKKYESSFHPNNNNNKNKIN